MAHSEDKPETAEPVVKGSKGKDTSVTSENNDDRSEKTTATQEKEILGNKDSNKDKSKLKSKSHLSVKNHNNDHANPKYEKNCNKDGEYSSRREKHSGTPELCKAKDAEQKEKKEISLSESKRKKRKDSHRESSSSEEEKSKTSSRQRHSSKASSHDSERNLRKTRKQHHRRSRGSGSSSPFHSSSSSSSSSCTSSSSDSESSVNSNSESNDSHSEKKRRKVEGHSSSEGKLSKKKYSTHSKERKNENPKSLDGIFKEKSPGSTPAIEEDSDISRLEEGEDTSSLPMDGDWKLHPGKQIKKEENTKYLKPGTRKLSISSHRKIKQEDSSSDQKSPKKRRWGSSTSSLPKASLSISTDSLKTLIPDYKPVMTVLTEVEELIPATTPDDSPGAKKEKLPVLDDEEKQDNQDASPAGETSPLKAPQIEGSRVASPSHNPPSCIIHIKNLVRPFTLQQLKDLLNQTGTLVERGFWIDKIKSKCYVTYETEEQAIRTRDLLHNARWPISNPKTLIVDFATQDELDYHKDLSSQPPKVAPPSGLEKGNSRGQFHLEDVGHRRREEREDRRREKGKQREEAVAPPIREWDKDKVAQESPEREHRQKSREKEKPRSAEKKKDKKDSKRKQEEETPAKLLDGLFRKTKTTPCIYWLPLTEEQIQQRKQQKEEMRQKRMQEKKEQEEAERSRQKGKDNRGREKETSRRSQSRSPVGRRR